MSGDDPANNRYRRDVGHDFNVPVRIHRPSTWKTCSTKDGSWKSCRRLICETESVSDCDKGTTLRKRSSATIRPRWLAVGRRKGHAGCISSIWTGAKAGRPVNHEVVRRIVQATGVKCELGGGIRDEAAIRLMLDDVGVERVIIGTQALKQPDWFREMAKRWPGRLVLGIDARDGMVATEGWLDVSKTSAIELAKSYTDLDLAAVVYTNIANDGMMQGVDEGTIRDMISLTELGLPVIASGGVTTLRDVERLAAVSGRHPKLIGAIIGRAIYEGTLRVADALAASCPAESR